MATKGPELGSIVSLKKGSRRFLVGLVDTPKTLLRDDIRDYAPLRFPWLKINKRRLQLQLAHAPRGFIRFDPGNSALPLFLELVLLDGDLDLEEVDDRGNDVAVIEELEVSISADRGLMDGTFDPGLFPSLDSRRLVRLVAPEDDT